MIITDYIKLQQYTTEPQQAFPGRRQPAHGVAEGAVEYYEVAGHSWPHIRRVRPAFDVLGFTACTPETSCRFRADTGEAPGRLQTLTVEEIAAVALQPSALRFA